MEFVDWVFVGVEVIDEEVFLILNCLDEDILLLMYGVFYIRKYFYGKKVKFNMIMNVKLGFCFENCGYCLQFVILKVLIQFYWMVNKEMFFEGVKWVYDLNIGIYCIVVSGRGLFNREVDQVVDVVQEIKEIYGLKVCVCFGLLKLEQVKWLKEVGVDCYNYNLNMLQRNYLNIMILYIYDDRVNIVKMVKELGLFLCLGVIIGMKEMKQDVIDIVKSLKVFDVDFILVNFLYVIDGMLLEGVNELNLLYCLKVLVLFCFINLLKEICILGGREVNFCLLQLLGFYVVNFIFVGDYLIIVG